MNKKGNILMVMTLISIFVLGGYIFILIQQTIEIDRLCKSKNMSLSGDSCFSFKGDKLIEKCDIIYISDQNYSFIINKPTLVCSKIENG